VVGDRDAQTVEREDLVTAGVAQRRELDPRGGCCVTELSDEVSSLDEGKCKS
jgi:hypothetical protein